MKNVIKSGGLELFVLALSLVYVATGGFKEAIAQGMTANSHQQPEEMIIMGGYGCRSKVSLSPENPKLGDNVEVTFHLETPYKNIPEFRVRFKLLNGAEFISGDTIKIHPPLKKGESAEFSIMVRVVSRHLQVSVAAHAHARTMTSREEWGHCVGAGDVDMITLAETDTISYEKFGNDPDLWPRIGPEYQYDIIEGVKIPPIGHVSGEAQKIRAEIEELKKMDPTLTDWDALEMLHDAVYEMVVRYGINEKEEALLILIKARTLMREKGLSKWQAVDIILGEMKNEKGKVTLFRPGRGASSIRCGFDSKQAAACS